MAARLDPAQARELRETEKTRYLAANPEIPDAEQRWAKYEDVILAKYTPANTKPLRFPKMRCRAWELDRAWIERDFRHSRKAEKK